MLTGLLLLLTPLPPEVPKTKSVIQGWIVVTKKVELDVGDRKVPLRFTDVNKFCLVAEADRRRAELTGTWTKGEFWVDSVVLYGERIPPPK